MNFDKWRADEGREPLMKRWLAYGVNLMLLLGAGVLVISSPDWLSMFMVGLMTGVILLGEIFGIVPLVQYSMGFERAARNIDRARELQPSMPWIAVSRMQAFFGQKLLDRLFEEYREKAEQEQKNGMIVGDIDEIINEDELALRSWQGVVLQIPGTLTGLGLLGTFIGLLAGISSVQVSSVEATLESIIVLFSGIQVAFYTSVSGVILSMAFNIIYKVIWNVMVRNLGMFITAFQRNVIPSADEQGRYLQKKDMQQIQEKLSGLPRYGNYSLSNAEAGFSGDTGNESVLMPQILNGLQNHEFTFYLQPRYDLNTQKIIGAEALVRWIHPKLGMVAPSVFIPLLEKNGYITKLDQYIWNQICAKMREWIDAGIRPVPISVNISKTDILALDISEVFAGLIQTYRLPPRCIEFDIAQNAYLESRQFVLEFEKKVQQKGFRIVVDGFVGDFFALQSAETPPLADCYKLDLRFCGEADDINSIAEQARSAQVSLIAEGIENMKQMSALRKSGITEGQGFYLSKSVPIEQFEKMMNWRQDA